MQQADLWLPDPGRRMEWWEAFWNEDSRTFGEPSPGLLATIAEAVETRPGCSAVDVASGNGRYAIPMAKLGCDVTAIEWTQSGAAKIEKYGLESGVEVKCECRNFLQIASEDRNYDIVFSSGLLEELARGDQRAAIEGYCRWTSPGGIAIIKYCLEIEGRGQLVDDELVPAAMAQLGMRIDRADESKSMKLARTAHNIRTGIVIATRA